MWGRERERAAADTAVGVVDVDGREQAAADTAVGVVDVDVDGRAGCRHCSRRGGCGCGRESRLLPTLQ